MTNSFRALLYASTVLAGLSIAPAAQAKGPGMNISPSMGGISSTRMDFNMRAPNALRDQDANRGAPEQRKLKPVTRVAPAGPPAARPPKSAEKPKFTVTPAGPAQQAFGPVRYANPKKPAGPKEEKGDPRDNPDLAALRDLLGWLPSGPPRNDDDGDSNGSLPQFPQFGGPRPSLEDIEAWVRAQNARRWWAIYTHVWFFIPPKQREVQRTGPDVTDNPVNPLGVAAQPDTARLRPVRNPVPASGGSDKEPTSASRSTPPGGIGAASAGATGDALPGGDAAPGGKAIPGVSSGPSLNIPKELAFGQFEDLGNLLTLMHGPLAAVTGIFGGGPQPDPPGVISLGGGQTTGQSSDRGRRAPDDFTLQSPAAQTRGQYDRSGQAGSDAPMPFSRRGVGGAWSFESKPKDEGTQATARQEPPRPYPFESKPKDEPRAEQSRDFGHFQESKPKDEGPTAREAEHNPRTVESEKKKEDDVAMPNEGYGRYSGPTWCGLGGGDCKPTELRRPGGGGDPGDAEPTGVAVAERSTAARPGAATDPCPDCDPSHYGGSGGGGGSRRPGPSDLGWGPDGQWIGPGSEPGRGGGGSGGPIGGGAGTGGSPG